MARLHKKKPSGDKKKNKDKNGVVDSSGSVSESSAAAIPLKAKTEKKSSEVVTSSEPNLIQKWVEFFREVKVELKKVTWPTQKQTTGTTIVVIIFVFVVAAFLGLFDLSLSKLVQVVLT